MQSKSVNPGTVAWSGENPTIFLRHSQSGPFSCLVSFFRVVFSPHGNGHAVFVFTSPGRLDPTATNACFTDNPEMAGWLKETLVSHFRVLRNDPNLPRLPIVPASSFLKRGDARSEWIEEIEGAGVHLRLVWKQLHEPFMVDSPPSQVPTGKHEMYSLFIPADVAEV